MPLPLVVVDAANVVGSVPDGWWRDRYAAAVRLRDALAAVAEHGLDGTGSAEIVLVVEGAARGVASTPAVRVVSAPGSGDDAIVGVAADSHDREITVITADRGLIARVTALGASISGPRSVPRR